MHPRLRAIGISRYRDGPEHRQCNADWRRAAGLLVVSSIIAIILTSCGSATPSTLSQDGPTSDPTTTLAPSAESILHHWQALIAIDAGDTADATHHVTHIIELVRGDHADRMRTVLQDLEDGHLVLAGHAIESMLADDAEPTLSPLMIRIQLALAALGRDDYAGAIHHVDHLIATLPAPDAADARKAVAALQAADAGDALLHLRWLAQLEAERLRDVTRCSGLGVGPAAVRDGTLTLILVLDEEWLARFGQAAADAATAVVRQAQALIADLGIVLEIAAVEHWASPAGVDLHEISHAAADEIDMREDAELLLVLTAQDTDGATDGSHVEPAGSHAITVRHHRDRPDADAIVLAHELGHLLDLTHADGTYMQARGFAENLHWSQCQKSAVSRLVSEIAP